MRFLPVNLSTLLVELTDLEEALALHRSLLGRPIEGVTDLVPAARTVMIRYRPALLSVAALIQQLSRRDLSDTQPPSTEVVEIPVMYTGEDLDEVSRLTGLDVPEIVARHTASTFTVAFCGFAPGFAYLVGGDPALHVPRRQTPRISVPAGSVAIAGQFSGVYPNASPGGWQIIGETPLKMWDLGRDPPALLRPGARVRFFDAAKSVFRTPPAEIVPPRAASRASWRVLRSDMPALFQDLGRAACAGMGVSESGALDRGALKNANRIVGNASGAPCLEVGLGTFSFRCAEPAVIAIAGAERPVEIRGVSGEPLRAQLHRPLALDAGDTITLGPARLGMRTYIAVRGGFEVPMVLGSASTDTLAKIGPEPITAGAVLTVCAVRGPRESVEPHIAPPRALPAPGDTVELDIVLGPRTDWFSPDSLTMLTEQTWLVTPRLSRVGIRLEGAAPLRRRDTAELPSEGAVAGAIQVPHDGQPVLFLADHPLTGGYPVIGAVADYHLDLCGQIPAQARIKFRPIAPFTDFRP